MTEIWTTKCCAVLEVKNLSDSASPFEAFMKIMGTMWATISDRPEGSPAGSRVRTVYQPLREDGVYRACTQILYGLRPFLLFTGTVNEAHKVSGHPNQKIATDYGEMFRDFIKKHDLGTVTETEPQKNFTGNMVKVYIWAVDEKKALKLYERFSATYYQVE